jgi:hypothetical protein
MAAGNGNLNDEHRAMLKGKMNVEIAAMVAKDELPATVAGQFLLERATAKAQRKGLIEAPTTS